MFVSTQTSHQCLFRNVVKSGMVAHTCNLSIWEECEFQGLRVRPSNKQKNSNHIKRMLLVLSWRLLWVLRGLEPQVSGDEPTHHGAAGNPGCPASHGLLRLCTGCNFTGKLWLLTRSSCLSRCVDQTDHPCPMEGPGQLHFTKSHCPGTVALEVSFCP